MNPIPPSTWTPETVEHSPQAATLETIVCNLAHNLGFCTALPKAMQKHMHRYGSSRYDDQWERGNRSCALRSLKDILRWHPELRPRAANWIKKGLEAGR